MPGTDTPLRTILTPETLQRAAAADLPTLVALDEHGLLIGASEDASAYARRLQTLLRNTDQLEDDLERHAEYKFEDMTLPRDDRIPPKRFAAIAPRTRQLYDFDINWVPGFYLDPSCSLLFGGAAIYQYPDFFTLFIIRRSFRYRDRWLIYSRDELLAHELCHVAHLALESQRFEETFAYQTSTSAFRRAIGGMFYRPGDSFAFLASAFLMLLAQILRTFVWPEIPFWPFPLLIVAVAAWLLCRHLLSTRQLAKALRLLQTRFGQHARPVLFRCTDDEIAQLAALDAHDLESWLQQRQDSLRWHVIRARFGT